MGNEDMCEEQLSAQDDDVSSKSKVRKENGWLRKILFRIVYGNCGDLLRRGDAPLEMDDLHNIKIPDLNAFLKEFSDGWKKEGELEKKYGRRRPGFRLVRTVLFNCFIRSEIVAILLYTIASAASFLGVVLTYRLIDDFVNVIDAREVGTHVGWKKIWITAALKVLTSYFNGVLYWAGNLVRRYRSRVMQSTLLLLTYRHMLNVKGSSFINISHMTNISSGDAESIQEFYGEHTDLLMLPFNCIVSFIFGMYYAGWVFLSTLLLIPLSLLVLLSVGKIVKLVNYKNRARDERVRVTSESVCGSKQMKAHGWEKNRAEEIKHLRAKELNILLKLNVLESLVGGLATAIATGVIIVMLLLWVTLDSDRFLLPAVSAALLLQAGVSQQMNIFYSVGMVDGGEAWTPIKTLENFLRIESITNIDSIEHDNALQCEHSQREGLNRISLHGNVGRQPMSAGGGLEAGRPHDGFVLKDIDISLIDGELLCILGPTGCGKTLLLMAMLQEAANFPPSSKKQLRQYRQPIVGRVAYAGQEPWIQSETIKENILFGSDFDSERYNMVIRDCGLVPDLEELEYGDLTIVGSHGLKLSGGQKVRVGLARLAYRDADVFIIDDPLSSVDSGMGQGIYTNLIRGFLREKTCVLVTHHVSYLVNDEKVIVMGNEGTIQAVGTWSDVKNMSCVAKMYNLSDISESVEKDNEAILVLLEAQRSFSAFKMFESGLKSNSEEKTLEMRSTDTGYFTVLMDYYFGYVLGWWKGVILFNCLTSASVAIGSLVYSVYVPLWIESPTYLSKAGLWLCGLAGLSIIYVCTKTANWLIVRRTSLIGNSILHDKMVDAMVRAPMAFFDDNPTGRILNRFTKDMAIIDQTLPELFFSTQTSAIIIVATFIMAMVTAYFIILFVLFSVFLIVWLLMIFFPCIGELRSLQGICMSHVYDSIVESVEGIVTIRAFDAQDFFIATFRRRVLDFLTVSLAQVTVTSSLEFRITCITFTSFAVFVFGSVGALQLNFSQSAALFSAVVMLYSIMSFQTLRLVSNISDFLYNSVSLERVMEYGKIEPESAWYSPEGKGPPDNWPSKGKISVVSLWARYKISLPYVLKGMSFEIPPGMLVGIVGHSGSGKSSLVKALFRILEYDSSLGYIEIDGIKTCDIGLLELRPRISIVSQEPLVFQNTIRYNMDPSGKASDVEIWKALEVVNLKECVNSLDTEIMSENRDNFSTGEKQLLCLARVLLKKSAIYVMDEATAFIDSETESEVSVRLHDLLENATVLMVAHRLHTIIGADRVLVVESGEIVEYGSPHELLKYDDGAFTKMVTSTGAHERLKRTADERFMSSSMNAPYM